MACMHLLCRGAFKLSSCSVFLDVELFLVVILSSCFSLFRFLFPAVEFFLNDLFLCSSGG
jgi:hypothetical protein